MIHESEEYVPGARISEKTQRNVDEILEKMLAYIGAQNFGKLNPSATEKEAQEIAVYHLRGFDVEALRRQYVNGDILRAHQLIGSRLLEEAQRSEHRSTARKVIDSVKSYLPWAESPAEKAQREFQKKELMRRLLTFDLPHGYENYLEEIATFVQRLLDDDQFEAQVKNWEDGGSGFSDYASIIYYKQYSRSRESMFPVDMIGKITRIAVSLHKAQSDRNMARR